MKPPTCSSVSIAGAARLRPARRARAWVCTTRAASRACTAAISSDSTATHSKSSCRLATRRSLRHFEVVTSYDSACFKLEPREAARRDQLARYAQQQTILQTIGNPCGQVGVRSRPRVEQNLQLGHRASGEHLDAELADLGELAQHTLDGTREHVHPTHDEHVVGSTEDATGQPRK